MVSFGLILDMDGVIIDSTPYTFPSFNYVLKSDFGVEISNEDIKGYVGIPLLSMLEKVKGKFSIQFDSSDFRIKATTYQYELMEGKHPKLIAGVMSKEDLNLYYLI